MFTEYGARVAELKDSNMQFQKLFEEHDQLDKEIKKIERRPASEFTQEVKALKKRKLELKEQLFDILKAHPES
ncbi:YdcH family protein [Shewanella sp. YIC-542]|uniref:YdcH family protein n=1 Tax=Shewanella mytili TaxID=3377111 RepID=UPI00398F3275